MSKILELKSELSKIKIPKKKPLENKKRPSINTQTNKTPISSRLNDLPKISKMDALPDKEGKDVRKLSLSPKFLGETDVPKFANKNIDFSTTDVSTFTFDPNSEATGKDVKPFTFDPNSEATGKDVPKVTQGDKFKGETDPAKFTFDPNSEATGKDISKFTFDPNSEATGKDISKFDFDPNSEATGKDISKFDFDPNSEATGKDISKFTFDPNLESTGRDISKFDFDPNAESTGKDIPKFDFDPNAESTGKDIPKFTFDPNLESIGKDPKFVDFITNEDALGFSPFLKQGDPSRFTAVNTNQTRFDSAQSRYGDFNAPVPGLSFRAGYGRFKTGNESGDVPRYTPDGLHYENSTYRIGPLMEQRFSPSFLDKMYNKFNLRTDATNNSSGGFAHPLILRGIQRLGITNGEPQKWGFDGNSSFTAGFIRGGELTSTTRAAIDSLRISKWLASPEGLIWSTRQANTQRTNRYGKTWNPVNLLSTIASQHLGIRFTRSGISPNDTSFKYLSQNPAGEIEDIYNRFFNNRNYLLSDITNGTAIWKIDPVGGFDSVYGVGTTQATRYVNTFVGRSKDFNHLRVGLSNQFIYHDNDQYASLESYAVYKSDDNSPKDASNADDRTESNGYNDSIKTKVEKLDGNPNDIDNSITNAELIKNYKTVSYGDMPDRIAGDATINDFRSLLTGESKKRADVEDYTQKNIEKRVGYSNLGKLDADRSDWRNTDKSKNDRHDAINASEIDDPIQNDLVHLWFSEVGGDSQFQFRGMLNGINESFNPSWESMKYNGRADEAYRYTTFDRSLSFNFTIHPTSRVEVIPMYRKLNRLASMTMPQYAGSYGYTGTLLKMRLGNLFNGTIGFIESLAYDYSDEAPWELNIDNKLGELPMMINVAVTYKVLSDRRPQFASKVYDLNFIN